MAEIRLMRPPVNGLEQTSRERCLSATMWQSAFWSSWSCGQWWIGFREASC